MSAAVMMEPFAETSPRFKARIAGGFYLLTILTGMIGLLIFRRLVVFGDAATTATNILSHESLFLFGFASDVLSMACYIAVTALFYDLFKPVNKGVSLLAAFFSLVGCAIGGVSCLFELAPLVLLRGAQYFSLLRLEAFQALVLVFLRLNAQIYNVSLIFFGTYCLLIGYLIFRSTFLPRILGALMAFAGLAALTYLAPSFAKQLYPYVLVPFLLGEGSLTVWLLVIGVKEDGA